MTLREEIALKLMEIHAIKLSPAEPFTWASGLRSPIYCDNRILLSYPAVRNMVISGFADLSKAFQPFDTIAGVATAGIAHGALLAERLELPFCYVRSKPKEHGRQNQIEGRVEPGQRVLVIEDLISTGGSSLAAVDALKEAGVIVTGVAAIFQYNFEKARVRFDSAGCPFDTLTDYKTLIDAAEKQELFSPSELDQLKEWHLAPGEWKPVANAG